jgi:hypothetical protein
MKTHVSAKIYNGLWNICFLVSRDNLAIGGTRRPISYLGEYRDAGRARFREVMKSHLIPAGKESGIWKRGIVTAYKTFRKQRLQKICTDFEKEAGIRLFRRS